MTLKHTFYTTISLVFCTLFFGLFTVAIAEDEHISGNVKGGFRILTADPKAVNNSFTVYRGDYIKFEYPESYGQLPFVMEELKYMGTVTADPLKAPFYKMKKAGTYSFSLGEGGGSIVVVELVRPNYIEVTADEAAALLSQRKPFILDVRTVKEYEQLHLKDTHLIPIQELQARIGELEGQKHEDIFVYCATGNRSTVASKILADAGFKRIYNLRHGVYDWARKGYSYEVGK